MEISELYTSDLHEKGAEMQVKDQFGNKLELYLTVLGCDSKAWKAADIQMQRSSFAGGEPVQVMAASMTSVVTSWRGFQSEGKDVEFTKESVFSVFINAPYLAKQVDAFMSERKNFMISKEASS